MFPAARNSMALVKRVIDGVQHGAEGGRAADAHAQGEDAHVLDAGVGQHPLEIRLAENEHGRHGHRDQPEEHQQIAAEGAPGPAADSSAMRAKDGQEGAVQQRPGKQRRNDRRGLAVGVGQPGVQRGQSHLRSVADQEEQERRLQPERIQAAGMGHQVVDGQMDRRRRRRTRAATARKKLPNSARAMPTEQISRYFQVASSER